MPAVSCAGAVSLIAVLHTMYGLVTPVTDASETRVSRWSRAGHPDASALVSAPLRAAAILDPCYDHFRGCDVVILRLCRALLLE